MSFVLISWRQLTAMSLVLIGCEGLWVTSQPLCAAMGEECIRMKLRNCRLGVAIMAVIRPLNHHTGSHCCWLPYRFFFISTYQRDNLRRAGAGAVILISEQFSGIFWKNLCACNTALNNDLKKWWNTHYHIFIHPQLLYWLDRFHICVLDCIVMHFICI